MEPAVFRLNRNMGFESLSYRAFKPQSGSRFCWKRSRNRIDAVTSPRFWIALLSSDDHLRRRLAATLETGRPWHVAAFGRFEPLLTFLRITPVEAVLLDGGGLDLPLAEAAHRLRSHRRLASPIFRLIALAPADAAPPCAADSADFDAVLPRQAPAGRLIAGIDLTLAPPPRRHPAVPAPARDGASMPRPHANGRRHGAEIIPLFGVRAARSGA
jgi:hypothetical protein